MSRSWKKLGLNYIEFSNIAAKQLRLSLKPELQKLALLRDNYTVQFTKWENGKPVRRED